MRSTRFVVAVTVLVFTIAFTASGQKETRDHRNFTEIGFGVAGDLYLRTGEDFSVVLEGDKDLLERVVTEIRGERLVIRQENFRWPNNKRLTVYVTMPSVQGLSLSGSGKIIVETAISGTLLDLSISGSGRIICGDLRYGKLECSVSGSGSFEFTGTGAVKDAGLSISGSGGFIAPELELENLSIKVSGSGSCDCLVTGKLTAAISGSGDVIYSGNPLLDVRASGSGKVRSK
jgi:hypothetical protein